MICNFQTQSVQFPEKSGNYRVMVGEASAGLEKVETGVASTIMIS